MKKRILIFILAFVLVSFNVIAWGYIECLPHAFTNERHIQVKQEATSYKIRCEMAAATILGKFVKYEHYDERTVNREICTKSKYGSSTPQSNWCPSDGDWYNWVNNLGGSMLVFD